MICRHNSWMKVASEAACSAKIKEMGRQKKAGLCNSTRLCRHAATLPTIARTANVTHQYQMYTHSRTHICGTHPQRRILHVGARSGHVARRGSHDAHSAL